MSLTRLTFLLTACDHRRFSVLNSRKLSCDGFVVLKSSVQLLSSPPACLTVGQLRRPSPVPSPSGRILAHLSTAVENRPSVSGWDCCLRDSCPTRCAGRGSLLRGPSFGQATGTLSRVLSHVCYRQLSAFGFPIYLEPWASPPGEPAGAGHPHIA